MAKYYEISQVNPTANGSSTTLVLVTNPSFEGNGIRATKVGEVSGRYYYNKEGSFMHLYVHVDAADIMVCGNAICTERTDDPFSTSGEDY